MADAVSNISFAPSLRSSNHLPPPISALKSLNSSSYPLNCQRLSVKLPSTLRPFSISDSNSQIIEFTEARDISRNSVSPTRSSTSGFRVPKAQKWWDKGLQPNMKDVTGAQDFVDSLLSAGDKLVIVIFFSPGCGGCKALHPKICQFAEMNPEIQFLQVNYEEHKSMCYSLGVHVLPFFRFYRGAQGRVCSFSCTNATIKKFKDALAKHNTDRCSLGPTRGLEEKELMALAANRELCFNYTPKAGEEVPIPITIHARARAHAGSVKISESEPSRLPLPSTILKSAAQTSKGNAYVG